MAFLHSPLSLHVLLFTYSQKSSCFTDFASFNNDLIHLLKDLAYFKLLVGALNLENQTIHSYVIVIRSQSGSHKSTDPYRMFGISALFVYYRS